MEIKPINQSASTVVVYTSSTSTPSKIY